MGKRTGLLEKAGEEHDDDVLKGEEENEDDVLQVYNIIEEADELEDG